MTLNRSPGERSGSSASIAFRLGASVEEDDVHLVGEGRAGGHGLELLVRPEDDAGLQRELLLDRLLERGGHVRGATLGAPEDDVAALDVAGDLLVAERAEDSTSSGIETLLRPPTLIPRSSAAKDTVFFAIALYSRASVRSRRGTLASSRRQGDRGGEPPLRSRPRGPDRAPAELSHRHAGCACLRARADRGSRRSLRGCGTLRRRAARRRSAPAPHTAVGGYVTTAVCASAIGLATSAAQVGALRAVAWGARGLRGPSRNALLADLVPASAYGRAYGFERAMDNLGAIGGPLLALLLVAAVGVRTAIVISVVPGLLAAVAIVLAVRAVPTLTEKEHRPLRFHVRAVVRGPLGRIVGGIAAFELANVAATALILEATTLLEPAHSHGTATKIALGLYAGYNLAATLVAVPGGHLTDRRGSVLVLILGSTAFAACFGGFAFAGGSIARAGGALRPRWGGDRAR